MATTNPNESPDTDQGALLDALERLFLPVAELCLRRGLPFPVAEEVLKRAFVEQARAQRSASESHRDISRVSAATGITRREVTRITLDEERQSVTRPSVATQIFTKWISNRHLQDSKGRPRPLKRQGVHPSFESLAQSVTQDVHHRTLLEELCRLGLTRWDAQSDTVYLDRDSFVPKQDKARMFGFLGNNVGDHLHAAVENVLADPSPHLEQAIFADELSSESVIKVRELVNAQWKTLLANVVPELEALIEADKKAGREGNQRVRVGLYSYKAPMPPEST